MSICKLALKITMLFLASVPAMAVTKVPSTVALEVTTPLTVFYGEAIDGLAQVTASDGSAVTGTVTFYDGGASFCTLTLTNGASCPEGSEKGFGAGAHVFTAVYSGDATHDGGTSNAVTVTVKQDTTTTALASSANPIAVGGGTVYTATVAGAHGPVSGTVTFLDGTVPMGSATLNGSGTATLSMLMLVAGDHAVTAVYTGNGNSLGSTSAVLHEMVNEQAGQGPPAGLTIDASTITVAAGDTVSVPVVVSGGSGMAKAVSLSCSGLPEEASCSYVSGASGAAASQGTPALRISTSGPRDCGSSTPYGVPAKSAGLPGAGPMLAGLLLVLVPGRRRAVKGLLSAICAVLAVGAMTGCGTGNCTDLGTRPGTYMITVSGSVGGAQVSQKVKLVVTP